MKLFSKIAFICNVSFIIFIMLGYIEFSHKKSKPGGSLIPLPFVTGLLVILGQLAIFINFIFCVVALMLVLSKKMGDVPKWLVIVNFIFLLIQVYYFFI